LTELHDLRLKVTSVEEAVFYIQVTIHNCECN